MHYYFYLNQRPRGVDMNYRQVLEASVLALSMGLTFRVVDLREIPF